MAIVSWPQITWRHCILCIPLRQSSGVLRQACLSVCLSPRLKVSSTTFSKFTNFSMHAIIVAVAQSSSGGIRISFVDDVTFSHKSARKKATQVGGYLKWLSQATAPSNGRSVICTRLPCFRNSRIRDKSGLCVINIIIIIILYAQ